MIFGMINDYVCFVFTRNLMTTMTMVMMIMIMCACICLVYVSAYVCVAYSPLCLNLC